MNKGGGYDYEISWDDIVGKPLVDEHLIDTSNPHEVTKAQVGLSNADNTSDANKPVSTATQSALDSKEPAAADFTSKVTASSETVAGKVELATPTETVAGTDTTRAVHPSGLAAAMAVVKNPLACAQGIHMTAASSGSNGIQVADDGDIDFGTGNFTLAWRGSLPDWTPSDETPLLNKYDAAGGFQFSVRQTTGYLRLYLSSAVYATTTSAPSLVDGTAHLLACVVTRETVSVAGSVAFYVDGMLFETVTIPAGTPPSQSNTSHFYVLGRSTTRSGGICHFASTFNRTLTAAEVLSLYRNGIDYSDKWGSQTDLSSSVFAHTAYPYNTFDGDSADGFHAIATGAGDFRAYTTDSIPIVQGKSYRIFFTVTVASGENPRFRLRQAIDSGTTYVDISTTGSGSYSQTFVGTLSENVAAFFSSGNATEYTVSDFQVLEIGATLALEPEGIQPAPGQWLDSSTNKLHAMQPAAGSSLLRKQDHFEVRWTNTWAGTHEAQYVGGVNQNVLPSDNVRIESITMRVTGAAGNVILGDGSDADRFVASVALAAYLDCTIANRNHDGTNRKLVIDPDTNLTGSITTTIRGVILD